MDINNPAVKRKPPKLKAIDRSISIAIDNYTPSATLSQTHPVPPTMIIDDSLILEETLPPPPPPLSSTSSSSTHHHHLSTKPADLYYLNTAAAGTSTPKGVAGSQSPLIGYDDYRQPFLYHSTSRKSNFRRSDTLDVYSPSNFQMRKTHSFHSNDPSVEEFLMARRTSSVRGSYLLPQDVVKAPISTIGTVTGIVVPSITPTKDRSPNPNRRSCRMHRSFNDQSKRPKSDIKMEGTKHPSLNDELLSSAEVTALLHPLSTTTTVSIENELNRSRSNSRTQIEDEPIFEPIGTALVPSDAVSSAIAAVAAGTVASSGAQRKHSGHKHSSHSLDQQAAAVAAAAAAAAQPTTQPYHFKRGTKHTHSLYLSPNSFDELKLQRSILQGTPVTIAAATASVGRKSHSSSMRVRPYKESLSATKKSKSFMVDTYPEFELSPHRRDSRHLSTGSGIDEIKRSSRPSTVGRLSSEEARSSFDRKSSLSYEVNEMDFDQVLRPFRQSRRKSSAVGGAGSSVRKLKKKSLSDETDEDDESDRKRKRIVCIIMTVFLCLVCASVFVVVITLTHSSSAQVQNQTRKVYTFSRDSPIHYNVRQENERLMQESMNRARFSRNLTEPASLSAASPGEIP